MVQLELDQEIVNELASLAHRKWAVAFDAQKAVKAETDDRTKDWKYFHAARLKDVNTKFEYAVNTFDAIKQYAKFE